MTDKALSGIPRSKIASQLQEVGFDESRQAEIVGGLSGGWKMKLELARAMLYNADLLLLDEVNRSHLQAPTGFLTCHALANQPCKFFLIWQSFLDEPHQTLTAGPRLCSVA